MEERQNDAVKRLRASLKECTVLRAETFRDLLESQQYRNRLTAELKEREKELRELNLEIKEWKRKWDDHFDVNQMGDC